MTAEEINKTIAGCLGIVTSDKWGPLYRTPKGVVRDCPDFCNDLNEMHWAEQCLVGLWINECEAIDVYQSNLSMILGGKFWKYCNAYAMDRAKALLMTFDKWRDA